MTAPAEFCPQCGTGRTGSFRFCRNCQFDFEGTVPAAAVPAAVAAVVPAVVTQPPPPPAPAVTASRSNQRLIGPGLVLVGGALAAVGSFLPWVTASAGALSASRNGIDGGGDGYISLILGGVLVLVGILAVVSKPSRTWGVVALIPAVLLLLLGVTDLQSVGERISSLDSSISGGVGIGLIAVVFGAVIGIIGGIVCLRRVT